LRSILRPRQLRRVASRCSAAITLLIPAAYTMCDPGYGYRRARTSVTVIRVPGLPGEYRPKI
jgi:hypothetical protein